MTPKLKIPQKRKLHEAAIIFCRIPVISKVILPMSLKTC